MLLASVTSSETLSELSITTTTLIRVDKFAFTKFFDCVSVFAQILKISEGGSILELSYICFELYAQCYQPLFLCSAFIFAGPFSLSVMHACKMSCGGFWQGDRGATQPPVWCLHGTAGAQWPSLDFVRGDVIAHWLWYTSITYVTICRLKS